MLIAALLVGPSTTPAYAGAAAPPAKLAPCLACHGADGQSQTAGVPSLGGQPSKYLLIQLFLFREGLRTAAPMNALTKGWSDAELQQAADFLARLPPPKPPADAGDPARLVPARALIADNHCNVCHRPDFSGQDNVPRLADQREDYLLTALRGYKSGVRRGYDSTMAEVLQPIGEAQLPDCAYYLSHWRPGK
ncbi:MAG TPA: c-type cytochrome [Stellaceae bacterium]|nr:c-type cytochrome [Stellaceae bacterium]